MTGTQRVDELSEDALLGTLLPGLHLNHHVGVGVGDDAAVLHVTGPLVVTTDTMVREVDWRDDWSTPYQVGAKLACQNLADVAAMGAVPIAVVSTIVMPGSTPVSWVKEWFSGLAQAVEATGASVVGGDLAGTQSDVVVVSVTAHGLVTGSGAVLRSGAHVGDVIAVAGTLGVSAAGLELLQRGEVDQAPQWVDFHTAPVAPYQQGPLAAQAGATSMIDLSDGLFRDAHRVASASGVALCLEADLVADDVDRLRKVLGDQRAFACVTSGGEEHSLLATFPPHGELPAGWRRLGTVEQGAGVYFAGTSVPPSGWDHFGG